MDCLERVAAHRRLTIRTPFPGDLRIAGRRVNSYKVFLCIGIYAGTLLTAAVGARSGLSPLRVAAGCMVVVIVGLIGARLFHLAINAHAYWRTRSSGIWDRGTGGLNVLGGLLVVPIPLVFNSIWGIPAVTLADHLAFGIAFGGAWIRFGCICNGCCVGRESHHWWAARQPDTLGVVKNRIPVQWLEIGWWLLALGGLFWLWPARLPRGFYALGVPGWYGFGRFWLEPLREERELAFNSVPVNQLVAGLLAVVAGGRAIWMVISAS